MKLRETVQLKPQDTAGKTLVGEAAGVTYTLREGRRGWVLFVGEAEHEENEVKPRREGVASPGGFE